MASGKNTAANPIIQIAAHSNGVAIGPPSISPRETSTSLLTGEIVVHACNQPGMVEDGTNTLLPKVNGIITATITPCAAVGADSSMPTHTPSQHNTSPAKI